MREETITVKVAVEHAHPVQMLKPDRPSRADLGDVNALAASMALEGQRHPVVLGPDNRLLKGRRRLAAAERLGWTTIQAKAHATVEDVVEAIVAQRDETCKSRSMVEAVDLCVNIESLPRRHRPDRGIKGYDTYQVVALAAFSSGSQYKRARYVVDASRSMKRPAHVVEVAQSCIVQVDAGFTITAAYNLLKVAEKVERVDGLGMDGLPMTPPPMSSARSVKAIKLRRDWIRALAAKGATTEDIAKTLGLTVGGLRNVLKKMALEVPADKALNRTQRRAQDPNRAMRVVLEDLEALVWSLEHIDVAGLDVGESEGWATQLKEYARSIDRAARKTKEHA